MSHFIHTKEGVQIALGLNTIQEVNYYLKKAEKRGLKPSRIIGGVELFDIDILLGKKITIEKIASNNNFYSKDDLIIFATGHLF